MSQSSDFIEAIAAGSPAACLVGLVAGLILIASPEFLGRLVCGWRNRE